MASIISTPKVSHQLFKCFNCGRKTVSLANENFIRDLQLNEWGDADLDKSMVNQTLDLLNDDWQATCSRCGWSDS